MEASQIQHGEPRRLVMSAPTPLRQDFDAPQVRGLARKTKDGPQARRLLALAAIYDGATRTEAAKIGGVGLSRRPLLCGMEQARRSALAHHVHRTAPMGPRVLINGIWYNIPHLELHAIVRVFSVEFFNQGARFLRGCAVADENEIDDMPAFQPMLELDRQFFQLWIVGLTATQIDLVSQESII